MDTRLFCIGPFSLTRTVQQEAQADINPDKSQFKETGDMVGDNTRSPKGAPNFGAILLNEQLAR
jgi:hypothetical protein